MRERRGRFTTDLFRAPAFDNFREYDVSADGDEFVGFRAVSATEPERRLVIVSDWASTQPR